MADSNNIVIRRLLIQNEAQNFIVDWLMRHVLGPDVSKYDLALKEISEMLSAAQLEGVDAVKQDAAIDAVLTEVERLLSSTRGRASQGEVK